MAKQSQRVNLPSENNRRKKNAPVNWIVPEKGSGRASVDKVIACVVARDVGEPQRSFGINCHTRRVNATQGSVVVLHHPINRRFGPTVGWLTFQAERRSFLRRDSHRQFVLERIQIRFANENRIGCGRSPLVVSKTLILTWRQKIVAPSQTFCMFTRDLPISTSRGDVITKVPRPGCWEMRSSYVCQRNSKPFLIHLYLKFKQEKSFLHAPETSIASAGQIILKRQLNNFPFF